jgi:putative two-component system response regulator
LARLEYHLVRLERMFASGREPPVAQASDRKHILVINDTVAILELFTTLLEEEGYRVTTDGFSVEMIEMLNRVKNDPPDLIVLDFVILDEGKGWQFLQLLKMDRETRDIPVIVCTAAAKMVEELQVHLDDKTVAVILKPFDIDDLLAKIAQVWASSPPPRR